MSQELEQNQMDQFEHLLELSFLRERRKQMKRRLQFEERSIERLKLPKIENRKGVKFQLDNSYNYDRIKFREATQILEAQRQAKAQKIKNITMFTILIIIALAIIIYYFSK
jgi:predicted nucleic acid-binding Zn ribbon protein